ncbi:hypothetical protein KY289_006411 [Solanum tuberosum]|nr:hypothetical protein KY289_006411 [Solanum tuberosum]
MDIRACKMLREFHLNCSKLPNGLDPENFCSDFPHLETLLMGPEKPINISGSSLRKWILSIPQGVIKKLYGRRNRNCCSGTHDKCWRHFLKYFEVKEEEEKEHPDAPSSLYAHPRKDEFRPAISMAQELQ